MPDTKLIWRIIKVFNLNLKKEASLARSLWSKNKLQAIEDFILSLNDV